MSELDPHQVKTLNEKLLDKRRRLAGQKPRPSDDRAQTLERPRLQAVPQDYDLDDALATLLDDGAEVVVGFLDESSRMMFHRRTWLLRFRIVEGEHSGRLLAWFMRALDPRRVVARGSAIATSYTVATGLRPPRDLPRRKPSYWLSGAQFVARTRVVGRDTHGVERPLAASYSVISAILKCAAGAPPALQERGR